MYEQLNQMVRSFGWGGRYLVLALITVDHNANVFILGVTGGAEALRRPPCPWPEVSPHTLTTGSCFEAWVSLFLVLSSPLSRSFLSLLLLSSRSAPVLQGQSHWAPPPTWIPHLCSPKSPAPTSACQSLWPLSPPLSKVCLHPLPQFSTTTAWVLISRSRSVLTGLWVDTCSLLPEFSIHCSPRSVSTLSMTSLLLLHTCQCSLTHTAPGLPAFLLNHTVTCPEASPLLLNMPANLENLAVTTGLEKVSFHSNPKKGNAKVCSNYCTITLISHASKVMLKILQVRLQQCMY